MYMDDLASDRRGRPTDRTKTPEEIAQEEREKLVELEVKNGSVLIVLSRSCG